MKKNKNYIVLSIILVITIVIVFYVLQWYKIYKEELNNKAYITEYLNELMIDEYNNYINDNRNVVIYFGIPDDNNCYEFEKNFKTIINNYSLTEEIVYMNVEEWKGIDLADTLNNKYNNKELESQNKKFIGVPALGIYKDAILVNLISGEELTKETATLLLKEYDFIENGI
jgi:hypothetical protein